MTIPSLKLYVHKHKHRLTHKSSYRDGAHLTNNNKENKLGLSWAKLSTKLAS